MRVHKAIWFGDTGKFQKRLMLGSVAHTSHLGSGHVRGLKSLLPQDLRFTGRYRTAERRNDGARELLYRVQVARDLPCLQLLEESAQTVPSIRLSALYLFWS